MKCGGKAVEIQGSLSELKISSMEIKRPHICRSEGRGGFVRCRLFEEEVRRYPPLSFNTGNTSENPNHWDDLGAGL